MNLYGSWCCGVITLLSSGVRRRVDYYGIAQFDAGCPSDLLLRIWQIGALPRRTGRPYVSSMGGFHIPLCWSDPSILCC